MEAYRVNLYSLTNLNKDIDIKTNLLNKTWRVFNDSETKEICVFKEDGILIVSKDGTETTVSWELNASENCIIIGENKLFPSYKDNILFVFTVPNKGDVVFIDEQNEMSIVPTSKQDLYDYFQKAELVYYRFGYTHYSSATTHIWNISNILIGLLVVVLMLCAMTFVVGAHPIERLLVEFGIDNVSWVYISILTILLGIPLLLLFGHISNYISNYWNSLEKRVTENDRTISQRKWIVKNINDNRWKQFGNNLFLYIKKNSAVQRHLAVLDAEIFPHTMEKKEYFSLHPQLIGMYDERIETRNKLFDVNKEITKLRETSCKNISKVSWGIIYFLIAIASVGIEFAFCQILPPPFRTIEGIWAIILLSGWFLAIFVSIWQFVDLVVAPYYEYKQTCNTIKKWIKENSKDWRKNFFMFNNYSDYKQWRYHISEIKRRQTIKQ